MDFIEKMRELSAQISKRIEHVDTEEATKNAMVMPFINTLGYNVYDPMEVVPEFTADVGLKKGEKVDYAIMKDGQPIILIECKTYGSKLDSYPPQLFRYFSTTTARFGILTDGATYLFYSDLDKPNLMDDRPFLVLDLINFDEKLVDELKKFTKSAFDIDDIMSVASDLKYKREIKALLATEFNSPSEEFVKYFAKRVYSRPLRQQALDDFTEIVKSAFRSFVTERLENRLKTALDTETSEVDAVAETDEAAENGDERITDFSEEERDGYLIVKAIVSAIVEPKRVFHRDTMSYCNVLLDDTIRKTICRLHFNRSQKYLGLIEEDKNEERIPIEDVNDIYQYGERLKAIVQRYENA